MKVKWWWIVYLVRIAARACTSYCIIGQASILQHKTVTKLGCQGQRRYGAWRKFTVKIIGWRKTMLLLQFHSTPNLLQYLRSRRASRTASLISQGRLALKSGLAGQLLLTQDLARARSSLEIAPGNKSPFRGPICGIFSGFLAKITSSTRLLWSDRTPSTYRLLCFVESAKTFAWLHISFQ